ncbi:hypothetical protein BDV38DRAFT_286443 [Aspergillus pseudotamarii]|uniref:ATPase AAA-type core domain-containing protein n=1 Tax=Aspergillus pseudotamarii TaxID=132259 RepID=A0A5N6SGM6_ASPPS|nr:uncharacterized protein BDV38DRAFT_286443 [Aspergillus pseudotamarii]KAE8133822.1 hypothetical protein BDV38DRAFT_286443 [Aspergillus pseudotamarii]
MAEKDIVLVGNDSQHVVFTETETGSGKAKVSGLKGGVHLLKYFLGKLMNRQEGDMVANLENPHSSIELFRDKKNKDSFRVQRQLHIGDPKLKEDKITVSARQGAAVVLLEDHIQNRDEEIWKLFKLVNELQETLLVCKISRPLSKEYRVNVFEVLEKVVSNLDDLKQTLKEFLLLDAQSVEALNGWEVDGKKILDALKGEIPAGVTNNENWKWLKELTELPTYSINQALMNNLQSETATAGDKNLLGAIQRVRDCTETELPRDIITPLDATGKNYVADKDLFRLLEGKAVEEGQNLLTALQGLLPDIQVLGGFSKAGRSLLDALVEKYEKLGTRPVIIVDAEDLRQEGVQLSYHLSWSKTVEEFTQFLSSDNPFATDLKRFKDEKKALHLIVRFGCDGIIHYDKENPQQLNLYYANSKFVEGDYVQHMSGAMIGEATAFTAGLVSKLAGESAFNMQDAIACGMKAACSLVSKGFASPDPKQFMYPNVAEGAPTMYSENKPLTINIDDISKVETGRWSILTNGHSAVAKSKEQMLKLAKNIVKQSTDKALEGNPTAQFGNLVTVDREEMENFRGIANLVQDYMKTPQTKPLSIGVFGFPGSGKSFGVGEVIKAVASGQGKEIHKLEFNLSQFLEYSDLLAAFQSIRDQTFSNKVPVVMFDEFDCSFGGKALGWLQYFLAPMQDGKFLERGHLRPLGSAIFIFVGGTSPTFAEFQATARKPAAVAAKKPDFVSRLRGSVDIWGPNKLSSRDDSDETYTVRRAIILRSLLEKNGLVGPKVGGRQFKVAEDVLKALLNVSGFHHGTRSLEAIIKMSRITPGEEFTAAGLPSADRLALYVDPIEFGEWLKGWRDGNVKKREAIESDIYDAYKNNQATVNDWEPSHEENMLLSKAVAKNISSFLDSSKATDLTKWEKDPRPDQNKEKKIKEAIAHGVYDQLKAIRSDRRMAAAMMPWWFVEKQNDPRNRYFVIADTVWERLTGVKTAAATETFCAPAGIWAVLLVPETGGKPLKQLDELIGDTDQSVTPVLDTFHGMSVKDFDCTDIAKRQRVGAGAQDRFPSACARGTGLWTDIRMQSDNSGVGR